MALVIVLLASMLMCALVGALSLEGQSESAIAGNYRDSLTALYAAEAAAGLVIARLPSSPQWVASAGPVVSGRLDGLLGVPATQFPTTVTASFVDAGVPDRIAVIAQATGPGSAQRTVRITVARATDPADLVSLRIVAWEEVR